MGLWEEGREVYDLPPFLALGKKEGIMIPSFGR